jgi:hypothetical protein
LEQYCLSMIPQIHLVSFCIKSWNLDKKLFIYL